MNKQEARERAELASWEKHVNQEGPEFRRPDIFFAGRASLEPLVQQLVDALWCATAHASFCGCADFQSVLAAAREQGFEA